MGEDIVATAMAESLQRIAETVERRRAGDELTDEYALGWEAGGSHERQRIAGQLRGILTSRADPTALHALLRDLGG